MAEREVQGARPHGSIESSNNSLDAGIY